MRLQISIEVECKPHGTIQYLVHNNEEYKITMFRKIIQDKVNEHISRMNSIKSNLDLEVFDMGLSVRAINALYKVDVNGRSPSHLTLGDILKLTKTIIRSKYGTGESTIQEIADNLKKRGYDLPE